MREEEERKSTERKGKVNGGAGKRDENEGEGRVVVCLVQYIARC